MMRALAALLSLCVLAACGGETPRPRAHRQENLPTWTDVFEGTPDLYAVVRPQAIKRDGVYGTFWTALLRAAQARGYTRGATMVEAIEGADEILLGLNKG